MPTNVLDENVVILKFDNSNFKKNTEDSIKTLDRLKASLRDSKSSDALEDIGKATKTIDLSGMGKAIDKVNKRFSLFGIAGMSAINKLTTSAMASVKNLVTAIPNQAISGGWQRALNIENAKFLIEGLGKDMRIAWDETTDYYEEGMAKVKDAVDAAVQGTRYSLDEAALVGSQLLSSGVTDMEKLENSLKAVSGLGSILNQDYSRVGRIFAQVAGSGLMAGNDLNQLSDMGFNAAAAIRDFMNANVEFTQNELLAAESLSKHANVVESYRDQIKWTEADVRDLITNGGINYELFHNSFVKYFEQAEKANDTYTGSLANLKSAINRIGETFEAVKLQNLTKIFNALLPVVKQLKTFIDPLTKKMAGLSTKVVDFMINGIINPVGKMIGVDPEKLFKGFGNSVEKAGNKATGAKDKIKDLTDKVTVSAKEWQAALDIWYKGTYGRGQNRADEIRKLGMSYENVQGIINRFYANQFDWEKTKAEYDIQSGKKSSKGNEDAAKAEEKHTERLSSLGKVAKGVVNILRAFVHVVKAVKNIIMATWRSVKDFAFMLGGGLADAFYRISKIIFDLSVKFLEFSKLLNGSKEDVAKAAVTYPILYTIFNGIIKIIETVVSVITSAVGFVKDFIRAFAYTGAIQNFLTSIVGLAQTISGFVYNAIAKVFGAIGKLTDGFGASVSLGVKLGDVFGFIVNSIADFIKSLTSATKVGDGFLSTLGSFAGKIIGFLTPLFNWIVEHVFSVFEVTFDFIKKLGASEGVGALKDSISALADSLFKVQQPLDGVVTGMSQLSGATQTGGMDKVITFFSNIAIGLADFINAISRGENPLKKSIEVFKKVRDSLSLSGLFEYLKATIGYKTGKGLQYAVGGLVELVTGIRDWLSDIGLLDKLADAAKYTIEKIGVVVDFFKNVDWAGIATKIKEFDYEKLSKVILALSGSFAMIKNALDMGKVAKSASVMFGAIGGAFKNFGSIADTIKTQIKIKSFETIAIAIAILVGSIVALAMVPADRLKPAIAIVGVIIATLTALMIAMNSKYFDPAKMHSIGVAFAGVGVGVLLIATSMMLIAKLNRNEILKAGGVILAFMLVMALISARSKEMTGVGAAFMGLAVALNLLVIAVMGFAMMPFDMLMRGGEIILGLMIALSIAARIAKSSKPGGFIAMSAALLLLIPSIVIFSMLPFDMIKRGGGVIVGFILAMALASRIAGEGKVSNLGKMAIVIAILAAACVALSFIDTKRLMASAASISAMMISLGYAAKHAQKSAKGLAAMALVIATLAGALIALEKFAPKTATKNALAMAAFVGALGIVIAIFSKIVGGKTGGGFKLIAKASVGLCEAIDIFIANLLIIAALFSQLGYAMEKYLPAGQVDDVKRHVGLIGEILGTLIASFIKPIKDMLFEHYNDSKTLTIQFDGFIDNINDIMEAMDELGDSDLDTFKEFADAFSTLGSGSLKQSLANFFNSMSIFGWTGDNSIEDQIKSFGKGLDELVTICKEYDDDDMKKAQLAANIFGTFAKGMNDAGPTGGFATWFANTDLGEFGEQMSGFGSSMKDFIDEMDLVKLDKLKALMHVDNQGNPAPDSKLGLIASLVRALSNYETPPGGLKKFLQGYTDIATFGNQMTGFGQSMIDFIKEMDQVPLVKLKALMKIDGEGNIAKDSKLGLILTMVKALDKAGAELDPSGGVKQFFLGNTTLAEFMTDMAGDESGGGFGNGLRKFIKQMDMVPWAKLNAFMKIDKEGNIADNSKLGLILIMVKAFGKLAEEEIPETGGLWGWIAGGTKDLGVFGTQILNFVNAVKPAIDILNEATINDDVLGEGGKLEKIISIITKLNELDPPSETVIQAMSMWFRTKDDYDSIVRMVKMAERISQASFDKGDPVANATTVKDTMTELSGIKPPSEGVLDAIQTFIQSAFDTGTISNILDMVNEIGTRGKNIDIQGVSRFYTATTSITNSLTLLREAQEAGIPTLVNLTGASQHLKDFTDEVKSIKTENVESNVDKVITAVKKLSAITTIAAEVDVAATSISETGKKLGGSYISGVQDEKNMTDAAEAGKALVMAVWNYVKQEKHVQNFYDKGAAIAAGFLKGLKSKQDQIEKAAQAMVDAAEKAVEAEAQIKSPSKVFMKLGGFIGEGFVVGLESYSTRVYQAANKMATRSVLAANQAMESLELYGDPTITPVLDLTQVEAGAQRINALVTQQQAIAVNAGFDPATTQYATPWMMSELLDKMSSLAGNGNKNVFKNPDQSTEVVFNNYITVDGSENPEAFANRFVDQLKMQMRTT